MTEILRSRHRNKLNTYKQGRDMLFHVATKIPHKEEKSCCDKTELGRNTKIS